MALAESTHHSSGPGRIEDLAAVSGAVLGVRAAGNCGHSAVAVHRQAGGRPVLGQGTGLGERSWCVSATDHGLCGEDSVCACRRGADRGVPAPQIMEVFVEDIQHVRVFVGQIVVCQRHRSWRFPGG